MCLSQVSETFRDIENLVLWQGFLPQTCSDLEQDEELKIYPKT